MLRALRLGQAWGPSAAATCLTFKTPPAASLHAGIPQILFFWIYKIQSPSLCFGISRSIARNREWQLPKIQPISVHHVKMYSLTFEKPVFSGVDGVV